jgi:hypothetical protein
MDGVAALGGIPDSLLLISLGEASAGLRGLSVGKSVVMLEGLRGGREQPEKGSKDEKCPVHLSLILAEEGNEFKATVGWETSTRSGGISAAAAQVLAIGTWA